MKIRLIYCIYLCLALSCNDAPGPGKPLGYNESAQEIISRMISDIPVTLIDFDDVEYDTIYPSLVIGDEFDIDNTDSLFLASPSGCLLMNDSIYITDGMQNAIFVSDMNGLLVRRIGREGQAPGEFRQPLSMTINNNHIFVEDIGNRRIQVFDHGFQYIRSIPSTTGLIRASISANDSIIVIPQMLSDDNVIDVYRSQFPFEFKYSFFPHVDPHPIDRDRIRVTRTRSSVNKNGYIAATPILHPYIFLYNQDGQMKHVIQYTGDRVKRRNHSRTPEHIRNQGYQNPMLVHHLHLMDDDRIISTIISEINILEPNNTGKYNVTRRYRILFKDEIYERFGFRVPAIVGSCVTDRIFCLTLPHDFRLICYEI